MKKIAQHQKPTIEKVSIQSTIDKSLESFRYVIPQLQLLKSGFPMPASDHEENYFTYTFDVNTGEATVAGIILTSSKLKELLKKAIVIQPDSDHDEDYKWRDEHRPILKKLTIYCETLILEEDLWIPEADIVIRALEIKARPNTKSKKYYSNAQFSVISSPLPWKASKYGKFVKKVRQGEFDSRKNGEAGLKGGDLKVKAGSIEGVTFHSKGSDGEWLFFPEIEVNWPKSVKSKKFYFNEGSEGKKFKNKTETVTFDAEVIGISAYYWDVVLFGNNYNYGLLAVDPNIRIELQKDVKKNEKNECWYKNEFKMPVDGIAQKRVENGGKRKFIPGSGGSNGGIFIETGEKYGILLDNSTSGKGGYYIDPKITYDKEKWDQPQKYSKHVWHRKSYVFGKLRVYWNGWFNFDIDRYSIPSKYSMCIPELKYYQELDYDLKHPTENGKTGTEKYEPIKNPLSIPHPAYLHLKLEYLKGQFFAFNKKTSQQQHKLIAEIKLISQYLEYQIEHISEYDSATKSKIQTNYALAVQYCLNEFRNLDVFGNGPGYRPMLVAPQILSYAEKMLPLDIELYVKADILANKKEWRGKMMKEIPAIKKQLKEANDQMFNRLELIDKELDQLKIKAKTCETATNKLKEQLEKKEEELRNNEKIKERWDKIIKGSLKVLSVAVSVIPYGQPVMGQIVGNGLDAIADNVGEDPKQITASVMKKIDLSGVAAAIAKKQIKPIHPDKKHNFNIQSLINAGADHKKELAELYKARMTRATLDKEEKKIADTKAKYNAGAQIGMSILSEWGDYMVSRSEIDAKVNAIMAEASEFQFIFYDIKQQLVLREEVFQKISAYLQEIFELNAKISQHTDNIRDLCILQIDPKAQENPLFTRELRNISLAALDRIYWIEYQLVKTFEYTSLKTQLVNMSLPKKLKELYKKQLKDIDVEQVVEELEVFYRGKLNETKHALIQAASSSHQEDEGGRIFTIAEDTYPDKIDALNFNHTMAFNLQGDLNNTIIKHDQDNLRIMKMEIAKIEFDRLLKTNESIDVLVDLDNDGVLRNNEDFYFFHTYNKNDDATDRYSWTITGSEDKNIITNKSVMSKQAKALIEFITGQESKDGKVFTNPPAWTNLIVQLSHNPGLNDEINVKSIEFKIWCDYNQKLNARKKVFDLRFDDGPTGVHCKLNKSATLQRNYYALLPNKEDIQLELVMPKGPDGKPIGNLHFTTWEVIGFSRSEINRQGLTPQYLKQQKIKLELTASIIVKSVYKKLLD